LAEVLDELRVIAHHPTVGLDPVCRQLIHQRPPTRLRQGWREQGGFQYSGQIQVQILLGDIRQAELEANHFALLRSTETPRHRPRRLRQNRRVGRATATPHGAAATMEQQQLNALRTADIDQGFLRSILRPGRRRGARVLGRIGVANHDFLRAMQTGAITRQ